MKYRRHLGVLVLGALLSVNISRVLAAPVMKLDLAPDTVVQVPTHPSLAVMVEFPSPIQDYVGRGFTEDPGSSAGAFLLRWTTGDTYLAVSPLAEGARGTLHVRVAGESYPLAFFPAPVEQAWAKVSFEPARLSTTTARGAMQASVVRTRRAPSPPPPPARRSAQWLGVLDLLTLAEGLDGMRREALLRANPALRFRTLSSTQEVASGRVHLQAVLRNEILDTVALSFLLENTTGQARRWRPESLRVRVGEHIYHPVLSDLEPHLPARGKTRGRLVLAGDGEGGRNRLSVENDFRISLAEADSKEPQARAAP